MPLSVFRDVYQITHVVPGLEALLADRHRQHQLLSEVEPAIRRHLLYNRRALNAIFELMDWAAAFGLLRDFAEQLQFRETVTFQLVTRLTFPRPLIEGDSTMGGGPTVYDFACLEDWDSFVEDVEVHLLKRKSGEACSPSMCPFREELKMHSLYAFGRKAARKTVVRVSSVTPKLTTTKPSKASKGKKRPRREVESGEEEEEEEEEEVAKSGKKPATRKRSKPNTFSASAQKQTIIKCEIEESDSVLKVKDKRGVATKGRAKKTATSPAAKKPAKAKEVSTSAIYNPGKSSLITHFFLDLPKAKPRRPRPPPPPSVLDPGGGRLSPQMPPRLHPPRPEDALPDLRQSDGDRRAAAPARGQLAGRQGGRDEGRRRLRPPPAEVREEGAHSADTHLLAARAAEGDQ